MKQKDAARCSAGPQGCVLIFLSLRTPSCKYGERRRNEERKGGELPDFIAKERSGVCGWVAAGSSRQQSEHFCGQSAAATIAHRDIISKDL